MFSEYSGTRNGKYFSTVYGGPFSIDPVELADGRFWKMSEIEESIGRNVFTPNFEMEFSKLNDYLNAKIK